MTNSNDNAELAVIGSLLEQPDLIRDIDITSAAFANKTNATIYDEIIRMSASNIEIDVVTLAESLEARTGNSGWISILGNIAMHGQIKSSNISAYVDIIRARSIKRQVADIARRLQSDVDSGLQAVDIAIRDLLSVSEKKTRSAFSISESLQAALGRIEEAFDKSGSVGIPTGLSSLDKSLGGLHDSDLVVIGARSAMGKTALILNMMLSGGVATGIISGEQSHDQVAQRLIAMAGRVSVHKMRNGNLDDGDFTNITAGIVRCREMSMFINDTPSPSIDDIMRQARAWHHNNGIKSLFIDYLQKIKGSGSTLREQMIDVTQGLKSLAKELNIPVVVLSQISRRVDDEKNKRPLTSHLMESSIVEQEADVIMMLYRDEVYNADTEYRGIAELIIRKNRHGPVGTIITRWIGEFMKFSDIDAGTYE